MPKISSTLGARSTQIYEVFRGPNPISYFNRICLFDRTCFFDRVWNLESSTGELKEKIQICKEKAGIRGPKYSPELESWKKEVIELSAGVQRTGVYTEKNLPSRASPKNELVYNYDIAKSATDQELDTLSRNVSIYTTLLLIHPDSKVDTGVIFDLIAQNKKDPSKDILNMYIEHFSENLQWNLFQRMWIKCLYYLSSGIISGVIHTTFQNMLEELRLSTDGKTERIFGGLLDHLEKFLKDYSGEKPLEDFIEKKDMPALCREISPHLVREFFPNISFFKVRSKKIPLTTIPSLLLDSTVGVLLNLGLRILVRRALPDVLQKLSDTLEATVLSKLTDKELKEEEQPINYQFAIPIFRFINEKLFGFATTLKEPPLDIDEPPPPRIAARLEGVIDALMKLSQNPSNNPMVREGLRNGLIDGGYQLMKYWQKEQETLLQQALILSSLPFTENQELPDLEADKKEFESLWKAQARLLETVNDRIFSLEVKKNFGTPSTQVNYLLAKEHKKIKRYLEEGLSEFIGLKSSLKKASKDLKMAEYLGFDQTLSKHLVFWEGFLSLMKAGTKKLNPKPATEMLFREFYPLCKEATAQVDRISKLQDEWVMCTRHKELKKHFEEMGYLLGVKRVQDLNLLQIQIVLNKIEILLPPNPREVQILKRFIESFSSLKTTEGILKDLLAVRVLLKKQKQGSLTSESLGELKVFLSNYPQFQKDKEFAKIYKQYNAVFFGDSDLDRRSKEDIVQEFSKNIEREIQEQSQKIKDLQLNLLHRIYPNRAVSSFSVPCPLGNLLKELRDWVVKRKNGYEILEKANLHLLQEGTKDLEEHVTLLERKIHKLEPHSLHFPLESVIDGAAWAFGDVGNIPGISSVKQNLLQELTSVLAGVTPLITAKKEEGKRNLYSWIETLALYEGLKYFKSKAQ